MKYPKSQTFLRINDTCANSGYQVVVQAAERAVQRPGAEASQSEPTQPMSTTVKFRICCKKAFKHIPRSLLLAGI